LEVTNASKPKGASALSTLKKPSATRKFKKRFVESYPLGVREDGQNENIFETRLDQKLQQCPLRLTRNWFAEDGKVYFNCTLTNDTEKNYEVGGLGVAMIFNQVFRNNSLDESHTNCVFLDPYIGKDAGYLQCIRLNGRKPVLIVLPELHAGFEAYRPLHDDGTRTDVDVEGFYEWTILSKAYQEKTWRGVSQWNEGTSIKIMPGETFGFSLKFITADAESQIKEVLVNEGLPVVESFPGYVLFGQQPAKLVLTSKSTFKDISVEPKGALSIDYDGNELIVKALGLHQGNVRVQVSYADGRKQTINYYVTDTPRELLERLSKFHVEKQWIDFDDPYGRKHSFITYDRENSEMVLESSKPFISGLSDEPGAGPNLLMAVKNLMMPNAVEIKLLEQYVDKVLWGRLQNKDYSVNASLYYGPEDTHWNKERGLTTWRAYNYPHQAVIYWVMYRLARNYDGLVTAHSWEWYLEQSYKTVMAMKDFCGEDKFLYLEQYGLMVGSAHVWILEDLKAEGWQKQATAYEEYMRYRYNIWASLQYPYGSEMPWDSTGQEEVYSWCTYFGDEKKAIQTVRGILAYTPNIPHWGYNGSGRRYFDSLVYGKKGVISREFHHYGASLNAIPIIDHCVTRSRDLLHLQLGYAASTGVLCNIDKEGFGSMAFLADPAIMDFEPYTSDYGQAFYGYVHLAGQYVINDSQQGWLSFGGSCEVKQNEVIFSPEDAFQKRFFMINQGVSIKMQTGSVDQIIYCPDQQIITIRFADNFEKRVAKGYRLQLEGCKPIDDVPFIRGAYTLPNSFQEIILALVK
jgi:Family of unknown function (DUF5695)